MTEIDMRDCMLFALMPQIEISHQHTARQKHKHTRCVLMTSFWQLGSNTVPLDGICNYCNAWSDMYPSIMICIAVHALSDTLTCSRAEKKSSCPPYAPAHQSGHV